MKRLLILALFLFALPVVAQQESGQCPAAPGDLAGQIACGELECDGLVYHAASCFSGCCIRLGVYCCTGGRGPRTHMMEGTDSGPDIRIRYIGKHQSGGEFNGWPGRVEMTVEGLLWKRGVYNSRQEEFRWDDGSVDPFSVFQPGQECIPEGGLDDPGEK